MTTKEGRRGMRFYKRVDDLEGVPVQFAGVYVTKWGKVAEPSVGFVEAWQVGIALEAADALAEAVRSADIPGWVHGPDCPCMGARRLQHLALAAYDAATKGEADG